MITDIKVHVSVHSYTATVEGNGGEEELVITATTRQDGQTAMVITSAQVDGDVTVLFAGKVLTRNAVTTIGEQARAWMQSGIAPHGAAQKQQMDDQVDVICGTLAEFWMLDA